MSLRNENGSSLVELMVAVVVMGIVAVGTADGIGLVSRQTSGSRLATGGVEAVREAILVLESLPPNSPYLSDASTDNDLYDVENPDFDVDPLNPPQKWSIVAAGGTRKAYRVFFNVMRSDVMTNMAMVQVYAAWDGLTKTEYVARTILLPVAP